MAKLDLKRTLLDLRKKRDEIDAQIQAIETLLPLALKDKLDAEFLSLSTKEGDTTTTETLRNFIKSRTDTFISSEVKKYLGSLTPPISAELSTISILLNRLKEEGLVRVKEQGAGRKPTIWEKV